VSATNRGAIRVEEDFYPTPKWATEAISKRINWGKVSLACEPCRGSGAIVEAVKPDYNGEWVCYEIREGFDYLKASPPPVDLSLTNPPYNIATAIIQKSMTHSACITKLLRINYLGSATRKAFLSANRPTHIHTLSERPSFVDVCNGFPNKDPKLRVKGCGAAFQKADEVEKCPSCGGKIKAGTDATEYAWITWDRGEIMNDKPGIYFL
jgi:hypothetical protein